MVKIQTQSSRTPRSKIRTCLFPWPCKNWKVTAQIWSLLRTKSLCKICRLRSDGVNCINRCRKKPSDTRNIFICSWRQLVLTQLWGHYQVINNNYCLLVWIKCINIRRKTTVFLNCWRKQLYVSALFWVGHHQVETRISEKTDIRQYGHQAWETRSCFTIFGDVLSYTGCPERNGTNSGWCSLC
jgi:hypothetical protein